MSCVSPDCKKLAEYSVPKYNVPELCHYHHIPGFHQYSGKSVCIQPGCNRRAKWFHPITRERHFCDDHHHPNYVDFDSKNIAIRSLVTELAPAPLIKRRRKTTAPKPRRPVVRDDPHRFACVIRSCRLRAQWSKGIDQDPELCKKHKHAFPNAVYDRSDIFKCKKCNKYSSHGFNGIREYCTHHKSPGMEPCGDFDSCTAVGCSKPAVHHYYIRGTNKVAICPGCYQRSDNREKYWTRGAMELHFQNTTGQKNDGTMRHNVEHSTLTTGQ